MSLLSIRGLVVEFETPAGVVTAVDGASLEAGAGECLAIVGESGSGKSQLLLACTGLLASNGRARGSVRLDGHDLVGDRAAAVAARGRDIGYVFQDAGGSLTPHRRIGEQLAETRLAARGGTAAEARSEARRMLERVRLPQAERCLAQYPHELSGGMRQRAAIAAALMARPRVLLADEPTTALDVTVQAQIVDLLDELRRDLQMALVLVTHDLGMVAGVAERVAVMYAGRVVEEAGVAGIFSAPRHPYTAGLLAAVPRLTDQPSQPMRTIPGSPPRPGARIAGCRFHPRCPRRRELCERTDPLPVRGSGIASVACHYPHDYGVRA